MSPTVRSHCKDRPKQPWRPTSSSGRDPQDRHVQTIPWQAAARHIRLSESCRKPRALPAPCRPATKTRAGLHAECAPKETRECPGREPESLSFLPAGGSQTWSPRRAFAHRERLPQVRSDARAERSARRRTVWAGPAPTGFRSRIEQRWWRMSPHRPAHVSRRAEADSA